MALLAPVTAAAQSPALPQMQFYSSIVKGGQQVGSDCLQEAAVLAPLLKTYHAPDNWTWMIICDEMAWRKVQAHTGQTDAAGRILGLTNNDAHVTYVRGFDLLHPLSLAIESQPKHTVAHELGHIMLNTHDEHKAEKKANELLKTYSESVVAAK